MKLFCESLYSDMLTEGGAAEGTNEEEGDDESLDDENQASVGLKGGSTKTNILRACVLNIWTKKLTVDNLPYCVDHMLGEWLKDGIGMFNEGIATWSVSIGESLGPIPVEVYRNVRRMAAGWIKNMNGKFRNKAMDASDNAPQGTFIESMMVASRRQEWETYFNGKILRAKVQLCGAKRERELGVSRSAEKRRALLDRSSAPLEASTFARSSTSSERSESPPMTAKALVGALGNFLKESYKADELLVKQLMEISTKNSDRVIRALSSCRPPQRPSPPQRARSSIYDEDDIFDETI
jgi:hypothetical protein